MKIYVGFEKLDTSDWVSMSAFVLQWVKQRRKPTFVHTFVLAEDTRLDFSIRGITVAKVNQRNLNDVVLVEIPYDVDEQVFFATIQMIANLDVAVNLWDVFSALFLNRGNHCVSVTASIVGYMPYNYTADQFYLLLSNEINQDCVP